MHVWSSWGCRVTAPKPRKGSGGKKKSEILGGPAEGSGGGGGPASGGLAQSGPGESKPKTTTTTPTPEMEGRGICVAPRERGRRGRRVGSEGWACGFRKFRQNTKTGQSRFGQSRSSPRLAKVGQRAGQSRFGQSRP